MPGSPAGVRTRSSGTLGAPVVVTPPRDSATDAAGKAARSASSGSLMWGALTNALPPPCVNGCSALCPISAMLRMPDGASGRMPAVVAQHDRAAGGRLGEEGDDLRRIGLGAGGGAVVGVDAAVLTAEGADAVGEHEDAGDLVVDDRLRHHARADGLDEVLAPRPAGAGHHEVEPAEGGADGVAGGEPVAHDDAVEAPLVLEQAVQQRAVARRPWHPRRRTTAPL